MNDVDDNDNDDNDSDSDNDSATRALKTARSALPSLASSTSTAPYALPAAAPLERVVSMERAFERYSDGVHIAPLTLEERMVQVKVIAVVLGVGAVFFGMTCVGLPIAALLGFLAYKAYASAKQAVVAEEGTRFLIRPDGAHVQIVDGQAVPWPLKKITSSYVRKRKPSGKVKTSFQLVLKLHDGTKQRFTFTTDNALDDVVALFQRAGVEVKLHRLY